MTNRQLDVFDGDTFIEGYLDQLTNMRVDTMFRNISAQGATICARNEVDTYILFENKTYCITRNGGELNIERVNGPFIGTVPLTWFNEILNSATILYRVLTVLQGNDVDWNLRWPDTVL